MGKIYLAISNTAVGHLIQNMSDKKYKVVILGDSTVGKSSILFRLKFSSFSGKQEATIGCEFFAKTIELPERRERPVKLLIWDTAGQEVFRSFTPNFLRGALAGIIVYDITSRESFEHVDGWLDDLRKVRGDEAIVALVGNKCDLDSGGARQVTFAEGEALAQKWGAKIFREASAKTGHGVEAVFEDVARDLTTAQFADGAQNAGIVNVGGAEPEGKKKGCC